MAAIGAITAPSSTAAVGAHGADVRGVAQVIDGDTLLIGDTRVRLEGIDAPESSQTCSRRWIGHWNCGRAAARELARLTAGRTVECRHHGIDKYGRMLGICYADGQDLNELMVRRGFAWAFVKYSQIYVTAEAEARAAKVGIWQGEAEPAWDYRTRRWAGAEDEAPKGCAIKGNVSRNGHIYHVPWSAWYDKVKIEPARGERWFCTEAEAVAAGWRPAQPSRGAAE